MGAAVSAVAAPAGVLGSGSPAAARGRPGVLGGSRPPGRSGNPPPKSDPRPRRERADAAPVAAGTAGRHMAGCARRHPRGAPPGAAGRNPGILVVRARRTRGIRRRLHRAAGGRDGRSGTHDGRGGLDAGRHGPARAGTGPARGTRGLRFARVAAHRTVRRSRGARMAALPLRGRGRCPGERGGRGHTLLRVDLDRRRASARRDGRQ